MRSVTQGGTGVGVNIPMEKGMQPVTLKDKAAINPPTMCFFLVFITDTFLQLKRTRVSRSRLKPFLFNRGNGMEYLQGFYRRNESVNFNDCIKDSCFKFYPCEDGGYNAE